LLIEISKARAYSQEIKMEIWAQNPWLFHFAVSAKFHAGLHGTEKTDT
jgi:hypothetical protein